MTYCKITVSPLLTRWSYCSLTLSHSYASLTLHSFMYLVHCHVNCPAQRVLWNHTGILSLWVFFYFVMWFLFCSLSLNFNWLDIFHLIFWIFSYYKIQIMYLFFFILARVDLSLYVNFWSCLWVHWVNWCQHKSLKGPPTNGIVGK